MKKLFLSLFILFFIGFESGTANSLVKKGDIALTGKKYCESYVYYKAALKVEPSLKNKRKFKENYDIARSYCLYSKGMEHFNAARLEKAYNYFKKAYTANPGAKDIQNQLELTAREISKNLAGKGKNLLDSENLTGKEIDRALDLFGQALLFDGKNQDAKEYQKIAEKKLNALKTSAQDLYQNAQRLLAAGKTNEALKHFEKTWEMNPDFEAVKEELSNIYLLKAYRYEREKKWGNALTEQLKLLKVANEDPSVHEAIKLMYAKLLQEINCQLGIDFQDEEDKKILWDKIYSLFFEKKANHLSIIENDKLKELIALHQIVLEHGDLQQRIAKYREIKELNYIVLLKIEELNIPEPEVTREKKIHKYILNEEKIINTEWTAVDEELKNLKLKYQKESEKANVANASGDSWGALAASTAALATFMKMNAAEEHLSRLEKYHTITHWGEHQYTEEKYTKTGKLKVRYLIQNINTNEILGNDEITGTVISQDKTIDRPFRQAGLQEDPLDLLTNFEINEKLATQIAYQLIERITTRLSINLGNKCFKEAQRLRELQDIEKAAEEYVKFLLLDKSGWTESHQRAAEFLKQHKSISWNTAEIIHLIENKKHKIEKNLEVYHEQKME